MSGFTIGDDIIDSRDLIEHLEELQGERDTWNESESTDWADEYPDDADELDMLQAACEEGEASPDWAYGATLVRDSYFTEYVMDMLADIGDLPRDIPWYIVIDCEATADNVRSDYFSIDLGGETYWVRA